MPNKIEGHSSRTEQTEDRISRTWRWNGI
jgi:hypothetical protein